jgi:DNA-binding MarR family transcriptional regulator
VSETSVLRRFNRTWTQRVGVLEETHLGTGLPLGAARVLWEVAGTGDGTGEGTGSGVRELRARLGLDSGHLTRLLRRLEDDGLARVLPDPHDGRRRVVTLTDSGRERCAQLEHRSQELAERLVDPLTPRQRARLSDALETADLLIRAATLELHTTDPDEPAAQAAVARYVAELDERFAAGFAPGPLDTGGLRPAERGAFVVATSDGEAVACGGLRDLGDGWAEVKRMWVDPAWRGAGLGARVLRRLEEAAAYAGHRGVRLDTHGSLTEAIAMYERAGYRRTDRYNDNPDAEVFFEKRLG